MKKANSRKNRPASGLKKLIRTTLLTAGGWILFSNFVIKHDVHLPEAVTAERKVFYSPQAGKLSYYQDRQAQGKPLVLIHSVNAAASSFEMRPLFEHFRSQRPVFALDLPGFGFSERSPREYSPELYTQAILDFLKSEVGEPADVVALSLAGEFAARAASQARELFRSLTLISPTGFSAPDQGSRSQQSQARGSASALYTLFTVPLWKRPFYDLLATRASIRYFLGLSFTGPVPAMLSEYADATSHQPGAENAPLFFVTGRLFTPDIRTRFYEVVRAPTLVIYDHDPFTGFEMLPDLLQQNNAWEATRIIPSKGMPHWEQLPQTVAALEQFWQKA